VPVLESERLTLRGLRVDDAGDLFEVYSDPEVMRYWSSLPHPDRRRTRESIESIIAEVERGETLQWAIERRADGRVLGAITLMLEQRQPRAELGYILGREHWGQRYAGEAQRRAIDYAFDELGLHRLEADTHPENTASSRSLERLGFRREGLLRERWQVGEAFSDSVVWGLLASDWRQAPGRRGADGRP
jgi:ribosomal-protein-alanine N-acetyltransferase